MAEKFYHHAMATTVLHNSFIFLKQSYSQNFPHCVDNCVDFFWGQNVENFTYTAYRGWKPTGLELQEKEICQQKKLEWHNCNPVHSSLAQKVISLR